MNPRSWQAVSLSVLVLVLGATGCATQPGAREVSASAGSGGTASGAMRPSPSDYAAMPDLKDIHFEFDRAEIGAEAARILEVNAEWLKTNPGYMVLIEGHADERGTNEYNLALGERRARVSRNYLVSLGVAARRISVISYGEERPMCQQSTEQCWSQNRRAHFAVNAR
jgi:peptidoglycan-associated lipoprotein